MQFLERLMCEVEFWEVFYRKSEGFLSGYPNPLTDCRIANLGHETIISWFSHRAGKMVHILSGCSFPSVDG